MNTLYISNVEVYRAQINFDTMSFKVYKSSYIHRKVNTNPNAFMYMPWFWSRYKSKLYFKEIQTRAELVVKTKWSSIWSKVIYRRSCLVHVLALRYHFKHFSVLLIVL